MNKVFRFLTVSAFSALTMFFSGCEKNEGQSSGPDTSAVFQISIISEESNSAMAAVICSAQNAETTWLSFCTEDLQTPAASLVALKIVEMQALGTLESSLQWGNKPVTYSGLEPKTEYRAIAAGVTADGKVYGQISETGFTTARQLGTIEEYEDWSITYDGRYLDAYFTVYDLLKVEDAGAGEEKFFTMVLDKADVEQNFPNMDKDPEVVREFIETSISYVEEDFRNSYGMNEVPWDEILYQGDSDVEYDYLEAGDYYLTVIGMTDEGEYTGLYARFEFSISAPKGSEGYNRWLGTWLCEDEEGVTAMITISPVVGDQDSQQVDTGIDDAEGGIYSISGWPEYLDDNDAAQSESPVTAFYVGSQEALLFYGYDIMEGNFSGLGYGYYGIYGTFEIKVPDEDAEGGFTTEPSAHGGPLATGLFTGEGSTAEVTGVEIELEDGSTATYNSMKYLFSNGQSMQGSTVQTPAFPFTMTPVQEEKAKAAVSGAAGYRSLPALRGFRTDRNTVSFKTAR